MKKMDNHVWAITAHGESCFLEECICSILDQTVKSQVIICTATDNEHIRGLAKKYNIPLMVKDGKDDVRDNWNFAYNSAAGEWITLAHQDDIYLPTYVEELQRKTSRIKEAALFFSDYEPFGSVTKGAIKNRNIQRFIKIPLLVHFLAGRRLFKCAILSIGNAICCPTVSFHKSFLGNDVFKNANVNEINENLDWELWIELAKKRNCFVYSPKILLKYRFHEGQETATYIENQNRVREDYKCFCLLWPKWVAKLLLKLYKKAYDVY